SGHIYDHFAIEYEYPNGVRMFSQCRQIPDTEGNVSEAVVGTKGKCNQLMGGEIQGPDPFRFDGSKENPYVVEHRDLIAAVRGTAPYVNEGKRVAESTMTAIIGRESAYSGQSISWDEAMNWQTSLAPKEYAWDAEAPKCVVAIPGKH